MAVLIASGAANAAGNAAPVYHWSLPRGFPEPVVPVDNPMSTAKVALGRRLFFETRLSLTGTISCASCHQPQRSFSDERARSAGANGELTPRQAMALVNVAYNPSFGWMTPAVTSLEMQMLQPLFSEHPVEMGLAGNEATVIKLLATDQGYAAAFSAAFADTPVPVTITNVIRAIASYERTLISGNSPFDRYVFSGEHTAITDEAKRGMQLFYSARLGCANCHGGFNFTGTTVHREQTAVVPLLVRNGIGDQPTRVPTLRNIARTGPYMHDGSLTTLDAVITHYENVAAGSSLDARLGKFQLTAVERREVLAFLESLTDDKFIEQAP